MTKGAVMGKGEEIGGGKIAQEPLVLSISSVLKADRNGGKDIAPTAKRRASLISCRGNKFLCCFEGVIRTSFSTSPT
jgi:hypothetical protein